MTKGDYASTVLIFRMLAQKYKKNYKSNIIIYKKIYTVELFVNSQKNPTLLPDSWSGSGALSP